MARSERSERRSEHGSGTKPLPDPQVVAKGKQQQSDEDQPAGIVGGLLLFPCDTPFDDIGAILFGGVNRLFLKDNPARRSAMSTAETLQSIPRR